MHIFLFNGYGFETEFEAKAYAEKLGLSGLKIVKIRIISGAELKRFLEQDS